MPLSCRETRPDTPKPLCQQWSAEPQSIAHHNNLQLYIGHSSIPINLQRRKVKTCSVVINEFIAPLPSNIEQIIMKCFSELAHLFHLSQEAISSILNSRPTSQKWVRYFLILWSVRVVFYRTLAYFCF